MSYERNNENIPGTNVSTGDFFELIKKFEGVGKVDIYHRLRNKAGVLSGLYSLSAHLDHWSDDRAKEFSNLY